MHSPSLFDHSTPPVATSRLCFIFNSIPTLSICPASRTTSRTRIVMVGSQSPDDASRLLSLFANDDPSPAHSTDSSSSRHISRIRQDLFGIITIQALESSMRDIFDMAEYLNKVSDLSRWWLGRDWVQDRENSERKFQTAREKCDSVRKNLGQIDIIHTLPLIPDIASIPLTLTADDLVGLIVQSSKDNYDDLQAMDIRYYAPAVPRRGETCVATYYVPGDRLITGNPATMFVCVAFNQDFTWRRLREIYQTLNKLDADGSTVSCASIEWMISQPRINIYLVDLDDAPLPLQHRHIALHHSEAHRPGMTFGKVSRLMQDFVNKVSPYELEGEWVEIAGRAFFMLVQFRRCGCSLRPQSSLRKGW